MSLFYLYISLVLSTGWIASQFFVPEKLSIISKLVNQEISFLFKRTAKLLVFFFLKIMKMLSTRKFDLGNS